MNVALEMLVEAIKSDYRNWMLRDDEYTNTQKKMVLMVVMFYYLRPMTK